MYWPLISVLLYNYYIIEIRTVILGSFMIISKQIYDQTLSDNNGERCSVLHNFSPCCNLQNLLRKKGNHVLLCGKYGAGSFEILTFIWLMMKQRS